MKCTDKKNDLIKSTTLCRSSYSNSLQLKRANAELRAAVASLYISSIQTLHLEQGLHLFGAALSFFRASGSVFLPWLLVVVEAAVAVVVFWALSLAELCAAVAAAALEDLEACEGFEVELEGCRRRLPSSPAEDE